MSLGKTKKVLVLAPSAAPSTQMILNDLKARKNVRHKRASLKDIILCNNGNTFNYLLDGKDIVEEYDAVLFRAHNRNQIQAQLIARAFLNRNKVVVDKILGKSETFFDKLSNYVMLCEFGVPIPKTYNFMSQETLLPFFKKAKYPVVIKDIFGSKGKGIYLIKNITEAKKFIDSNKDFLRMYIIQEFIPHNFDVRGIVLKDKLIGAIKRIVPAGSFKSNYSQGGRVEEYKPSKDLVSLFIKASKAVGYVFAGVDVLMSDGKLYVLEVNETPQFEGFSKVHGDRVVAESLNSFLLSETGCKKRRKDG